MNNTTNEQNEQPKTETYTIKMPLVPEESLMSRNEIEEFLVSLLAETENQNYYVDGLLFMLNTFFEMANQDRNGLMFILEMIPDVVYKNSPHFGWNCYQYTQTAFKRFRETDYSSDQDVNGALRREVETGNVFAVKDEPQAEALKTEPVKTEPSESSEVSEILEKALIKDTELTTLQICHVLDSEEVSDDFKSALKGIIYAASNVVGIGIDCNETEITKVAFPLVIDALNQDFARGVLESIEGLLDSFVGTPTGEAINQIGIDFVASERKAKKKVEPNVLDLSAMSTNDLETDDCDEEAGRQSLAEQLSNLVSNLCLPPELRDAIICGKDNSRDVLDVSANLTAQTTPESFKTILDAYSQQHGK